MGQSASAIVGILWVSRSRSCRRVREREKKGVGRGVVSLHCSTSSSAHMRICILYSLSLCLPVCVLARPLSSLSLYTHQTLKKKRI